MPGLIGMDIMPKIIALPCHQPCLGRIIRSLTPIGKKWRWTEKKKGKEKETNLAERERYHEYLVKIKGRLKVVA